MTWQTPYRPSSPASSEEGVPKITFPQQVEPVVRDYGVALSKRVIYHVREYLALADS